MSLLPRRSYLLVFGLLLYPALAAADGGCGSSFESWGCFKLAALLMGMMMLPQIFVGVVVMGTLRISGKVPGPRGRFWTAFLGNLPFALLTALVFIQIFQRLEDLGKSSLGLTLAVLGALQLVYVALAARWVSRGSGTP